MLIKLSADKTVRVAAAAMQAAVQANLFGVMQVHNLKETMTKKGVISAAASRVEVRDIRTDEKHMLAKKVTAFSDLASKRRIKP
jgi:acetate kinase